MIENYELTGVVSNNNDDLIDFVRFKEVIM